MGCAVGGGWWGGSISVFVWGFGWVGLGTCACCWIVCDGFSGYFNVCGVGVICGYWICWCGVILSGAFGGVLRLLFCLERFPGYFRFLWVGIICCCWVFVGYFGYLGFSLRC